MAKLKKSLVKRSGNDLKKIKHLINTCAHPVNKIQTFWCLDSFVLIFQFFRGKKIIILAFFYTHEKHDEKLSSYYNKFDINESYVKMKDKCRF